MTQLGGRVEGVVVCGCFHGKAKAAAMRHCLVTIYHESFYEGSEGIDDTQFQEIEEGPLLTQ